MLSKTPVLLAWSALYLGIEHQQELQAERERTLRLQPHLLFNSLNSLRALIAQDPARAREIRSIRT